MKHTQCRPIFIVGCPRSGTTLTRCILNAHPNISCGPETRLLREIDRMMNAYRDVMQSYDFDETYFYGKIADFFNEFKMEYAHKKNKKRWAEKTPRYSFHLDFISKLYPDFQVVHIIRDGRDVILSHLDRWGYKRAIQATEEWKDSIITVAKFSKNLPENQYFEMRYEELVLEPEKTLKTLFNYLEEPWDSVVLERGPYKNNFTERRRKEDNEQSLIYRSRIGAGTKKLDPFLSALFYFRSGSLLKELGYQ